MPEREKRLYAWITVIAIIVGGLVAAYTFMGAQGAENVMRTVLLTIASGALALLTAFIGGMAFFVQFRMSRVNEVISNVSIEMWKMSNAIEKAHSSIDEYSTEIRGFIGKMEQALTQHAQEFDQTRKQFHKEALALLRATESVMNYKLELSDVLETDDVARHMQVSNNMLTEWVGKLKTARDYEKIYWSSIFLSYMEEEQHDLANGILVSNMELYTTLIQKISTDLLDALPRSYRPRLIFVTPVCPRHFFNWPHQAQIFNRESGCDENYIFSYREDFLDRYRHTLKKLCNGRRVRVIRHVLALKKNVRKERLWEVNPDLASTRLEDIGVIEQSIRSFVGLAPTQLSVLYNTPAFETTTDLQQSLYDQTAYLRQLGISRNPEAYPIHN
ncbi:MAG: hypothetical protein GWO23_11790, partial [Gammaproteobacteria bacterium]|nr:hypothetical protein [Gammaproteobacteria bacterium]